MQKHSHFFSKNSSVYAIFNDHSFNDRLTNDIVSFEQLGPGILVRGSRWLCTQNLYANFRPWLTRHANVNKRVSSPDLLIFSQFHRHILKDQTMLFPTTFISASEKIGVWASKSKLQIFDYISPGQGKSDIPVSTFFQCKMTVCSAIWAMKYLFNISNKMYCNLRLRWNTQDANYPKHLFGGLKYLCRIWLTKSISPYGGINPYGDKPTVRCMITRPNYLLWEQ